MTSVGLRTNYFARVYSPAGVILWEDDFHNIVVAQGRNDLLRRMCSYIPVSNQWYIGLKAGGTPLDSDTAASHPSWTEVSAEYSQATRPLFVPGNVVNGAVSNSANKATFSIIQNVTVAGAFLANSSQKGGVDGTLYGVGNFTLSRNLLNGQTLEIQMELTTISL